MLTRRRPLVLVLLAGLALAACPLEGEPPHLDAPPAAVAAPTPSPLAPSPTSSPLARGPTFGATTPDADGDPEPSDRDQQGVAPRPEWLGTRVLPRRPDGFGEVQATPAELEDRRLPTMDFLPRPVGDRFAATVEVVPQAVAARSTWHPGCPVALDDLRYVTVAFWGFDQLFHTGELLVHASAAADLVGVFERLHAARFPIEEMRVVSPAELDLPPTGDGNNTTAFVCRPVVAGGAWSQHAYGLAVDVNPFHNPYVRGDLVLPELASAYVDRAWDRPGMVQPGDEATRAFAAIGWGWGGNWQTSLDWMHFSASGR